MFLNVLISFWCSSLVFGVTGYFKVLPEGLGCTQNFGGCTQLVCGLISLTTRLDLLSLLTPLVCVLISLTTRLDLLSLLKRLF